MAEPKAKPTRILLLTHSRTASHVLERMLSKQPTCTYQKHPFLVSRLPRREFLTDVFEGKNSPERRQQLRSTLHEGYVEFTDFCARAAHQDQIAFVHSQPHMMLAPPLTEERVFGTKPSAADLKFWRVGRSDGDTEEQGYTNPTVLPDEALLNTGTKPVINFRNPLLLVEGHVRGFTENSAYSIADVDQVRKMVRLASTLRWARLMYGWYLTNGASNGVVPIAIDADDFLGPDREAVMEELCDQLGLDPSYLVYRWPKATPEEIAAMSVAEAQAYRTLLASDGVMAGYDSRGRTLESEMELWRARHGEEWAVFIRDLVVEAMPDYEYLRSRRLVPRKASSQNS